MASDFYATTGLNVELYSERTERDLMSANEGDVAFYVDLARKSGGPVLELGCGNGRVLLPIARAGIEITGVDLSGGMLRVAESRVSREPRDVARRVTLIHGDMRDFDLDEKFALVIIAFRSFQMLLTPEDEQACLSAVRRHLLPGGRLVIDIFDPLLELLVPGDVYPNGVEKLSGPAETAPQRPRAEHGGRHPETGNEVQVEVSRRTNETVAQTLTETWRFTELNDDGSIVRAEEEILRMRWIYRWEMRYLFERQGFEILAEYSDFHDAPPAYGKEQVWIVRPAEPPS